MNIDMEDKLKYDERLKTANKERLSLWVNELRYGMHKQGIGALKVTLDEDDEVVPAQYCCLGVACLVYARETKKKGFDENGDFMGLSDVLPDKVAKWYGISENPLFLTNKKQKNYATATELNDDRNYTFPKIADLVEKQYING